MNLDILYNTLGNNISLDMALYNSIAIGSNPTLGLLNNSN